MNSSQSLPLDLILDALPVVRGCVFLDAILLALAVPVVALVVVRAAALIPASGAALINAWELVRLDVQMTAQVLAGTLVLLLVTGRALAIAQLRAVDLAVEGATAPAAVAVVDAMVIVHQRAAMAVFIPARPSAVEPAMDGAAENVPRFAVAAFSGGSKWRKANSATAENLLS